MIGTVFRHVLIASASYGADNEMLKNMAFRFGLYPFNTDI